MTSTQIGVYSKTLLIAIFALFTTVPTYAHMQTFGITQEKPLEDIYLGQGELQFIKMQDYFNGPNLTYSYNGMTFGSFQKSGESPFTSTGNITNAKSYDMGQFARIVAIQEPSKLMFFQHEAFLAQIYEIDYVDLDEDNDINYCEDFDFIRKGKAILADCYGKNKKRYFITYDFDNKSVVRTSNPLKYPKGSQRTLIDAEGFGKYDAIQYVYDTNADSWFFSLIKLYKSYKYKSHKKISLEDIDDLPSWFNLQSLTVFNTSMLILMDSGQIARVNSDLELIDQKNITDDYSNPYQKAPRMMNIGSFYDSIVYMTQSGPVEIISHDGFDTWITNFYIFEFQHQFVQALQVQQSNGYIYLVAEASFQGAHAWGMYALQRGDTQRVHYYAIGMDPIVLTTVNQAFSMDVIFKFFPNKTEFGVVDNVLVPFLNAFGNETHVDEIQFQVTGMQQNIRSNSIRIHKVASSDSSIFTLEKEPTYSVYANETLKIDMKKLFQGPDIEYNIENPDGTVDIFGSEIKYSYDDHLDILKDCRIFKTNLVNTSGNNFILEVFVQEKDDETQVKQIDCKIPESEEYKFECKSPSIRDSKGILEDMFFTEKNYIMVLRDKYAQDEEDSENESERENESDSNDDNSQTPTFTVRIYDDIFAEQETISGCEHVFNSEDHDYENNLYCAKKNHEIWVHKKDGGIYKWTPTLLSDTVQRIQTSIYFPGLVFIGTHREVLIYKTNFYEKEPSFISTLFLGEYNLTDFVVTKNRLICLIQNGTLLREYLIQDLTLPVPTKSFALLLFDLMYTPQTLKYSPSTNFIYLMAGKKSRSKTYIFAYEPSLNGNDNIQRGFKIKTNDFTKVRIDFAELKEGEDILLIASESSVKLYSSEVQKVFKFQPKKFMDDYTKLFTDMTINISASNPTSEASVTAKITVVNTERQIEILPEFKENLANYTLKLDTQGSSKLSFRAEEIIKGPVFQIQIANQFEFDKIKLTNRINQEQNALDGNIKAFAASESALAVRVGDSISLYEKENFSSNAQPIKELEKECKDTKLQMIVGSHFVAEACKSSKEIFIYIIHDDLYLEGGSDTCSIPVEYDLNNVIIRDNYNILYVLHPENYFTLWIYQIGGDCATLSKKISREDLQLKAGVNVADLQMYIDPFGQFFFLLLTTGGDIISYQMIMGELEQFASTQNIAYLFTEDKFLQSSNKPTKFRNIRIISVDGPETDNNQALLVRNSKEKQAGGGRVQFVDIFDADSNKSDMCEGSDCDEKTVNYSETIDENSGLDPHEICDGDSDCSKFIEKINESNLDDDVFLPVKRPVFNYTLLITTENAFSYMIYFVTDLQGVYLESSVIKGFVQYNEYKYEGIVAANKDYFSVIATWKNFYTNVNIFVYDLNSKVAVQAEPYPIYDTVQKFQLTEAEVFPITLTGSKNKTKVLAVHKNLKQFAINNEFILQTNSSHVTSNHALLTASNPASKVVVEIPIESYRAILKGWGTAEILLFVFLGILLVFCIVMLSCRLIFREKRKLKDTLYYDPEQYFEIIRRD